MLCKAILYRKEINEDTILEKLNKNKLIRDLLSTAIELIDTITYTIMLNLFTKESHAVKFVIPALVGQPGPLSKMPIRLKLLYALRIISHAEFEDIELLSVMVDELANDKNHCFQYTDDEILGPLSLLHDMIIPLNLPIEPRKSKTIGIVDSMKSTIYAQRFQQIVRSSLIIALTSLIYRLSKKMCARVT